MKSIQSIYQAKLAARDKQKLADAKKLEKETKRTEAMVRINAELAGERPEDSLPSVEVPAPYDCLGMKLAAGRCTYFAAYNHSPTAKGQSKMITHLAVIRECGKPLTVARHLLSWHKVNAPGKHKIVSDALNDNDPVFECYTLPFMFHNREAALATIQKTLLVQLAD